MPLRDHFHAPLINRRSWEGLHAQWPAMIVASLSRKLPQRYSAEPRVPLEGRLWRGVVHRRRGGLSRGGSPRVLVR